MRKRIKAYVNFIDMILANELPVTTSFDNNGQHNKSMKKDIVPTRKEYEALLTRHLEQIAFFSHERLVHLLVTILFAILTFMSFIALYLNPSIGLVILSVLLLILLIPYVFHYYLLENSVQKMYSQYDEIVKRIQQ